MYSQLLIDGDILVHKIGFAAETATYMVGQDVFKYKKDATVRLKTSPNQSLVRVVEALPTPVVHKMIDVFINSIKKELPSKEIHIILGAEGQETFRHRIAVTAPYKGNRVNMVRPKHSSTIREYLVSSYPTVVCSDIEADDMLGIMQVGSSNSIIASTDKDLLQIPGSHYNITTKEVIQVRDPGKLWMRTMSGGKKEVRGYGFKWFCAQMLLGDKVDNIIKPRRGLGDKAVFGLLSHVEGIDQMWKIVESIYKESNRDIQENGTLLWIQRSKDSSYKEMLS